MALVFQNVSLFTIMFFMNWFIIIYVLADFRNLTPFQSSLNTRVEKQSCVYYLLYS
jgi:hypothetical protein